MHIYSGCSDSVLQVSSITLCYLKPECELSSRIQPLPFLLCLCLLLPQEWPHRAGVRPRLSEWTQLLLGSVQGL